MFSGLQCLDLNCNKIGSDGLLLLTRLDLKSLFCFVGLS